MLDSVLPPPDLITAQMRRMQPKSDTGLTDTGIQDQHGHVRLDRLPDLHHLLEQLRLLLVPTGRVDNDDIEAFLFELRHALSSNRNRVRLSVRAEVSNLGLRGRLPGLVERARTERVCADDAGLESTLLVVYRELGACRRLAVTLGECERRSKS